MNKVFKTTLCITLFLVFSFPVFGKSIAINYFNIAEIENELRLDAEIRYRLNQEVRDALTNGIELLFQVEIQIKSERNWVWNKTISSTTYTSTLNYHALSKQYVWENVEMGVSDNFPDLESALIHQGRISAMYIAETSNFKASEKHIVLMRSRLLTDTLPLPLKMRSYFSPKWRMDSGWYEWRL